MTLISRNTVFTPEQVCGNKDQPEASLSSQPYKGRMKNFFEYFSFDNVKILR
jgi:hypothetical protein